MEYNATGQVTKRVLPLGQEETFIYDPMGKLISHTTFNGEATTYEYDQNHRLAAKHLPEGDSLQWTYSPAGVLQTVADVRGVIEYEFCGRGLLLSRLDPDGTVISYTYDGADNRTSVTTPAGTTEYTYDAVNRLETVTDPNSGVTTYSYDPVGNPVTTLLPNGALELREYDSLNRLTFVQHTDATSAVIASYRYTLDSTGRRLAVEEQNRRRVEYDYDDFYRLVGEDVYDLGDVVPSRTTSYVYDVVGNRLSRDDSVEGLTEYEYDDNDRLTVQTRGTDVTEYAHDDSGNLIAERVNGVLTASYEWDSENRLVAADTDGDGAIDAEYEYDPNGNRVSQTVDGQQTRFLLDLNRPLPQVLVEYEPSGIIRASYAYGRDLISQNRGGETSYYHTDGLGSTRALTGTSGLLTDRYTYDAFGQLLSQLGTTVNLYRFAGEQYDSMLGRYHLRCAILRSTRRPTGWQRPLCRIRSRPGLVTPVSVRPRRPCQRHRPHGKVHNDRVNGHSGYCWDTRGHRRGFLARLPHSTPRTASDWLRHGACQSSERLCGSLVAISRGHAVRRCLV